MRYKVTGKDIDIVLTFYTREDAERQIRVWLENDREEFGEANEDDYYIVEEGE